MGNEILTYEDGYVHGFSAVGKNENMVERLQQDANSTDEFFLGIMDGVAHNCAITENYDKKNEDLHREEREELLSDFQALVSQRNEIHASRRRDLNHIREEQLQREWMLDFER